MLALAYASAPLYRLACQQFGWGGQINRNIDKKLRDLAVFRENNKSKAGINRKFLIRFDARTGGGLQWDFEPVQNYIVTRCGESSLAFFAAKNNSNSPITGVSFYTILPYSAAKYFIKIQCFCFEEQRLRGNETVDMPVLFFLDPSILDDSDLSYQKEITLSYVFYEAIHTDSDDIEEDDYDDPFWDEQEQKLGIKRDLEIGKQMEEIIQKGKNIENKLKNKSTIVRKGKVGKFEKHYSDGHIEIPVEMVSISSNNDIHKLDIDEQTKYKLLEARRKAIVAEKTYGTIPGASRGDMRYYKQDHSKSIFKERDPKLTVVPQMKDDFYRK